MHKKQARGTLNSPCMLYYPYMEFNEVITFENDTLNDDIYSFTLLTLKCVQLVYIILLNKQKNFCLLSQNVVYISILQA